ncbi:histidinol-phosphate transaminase [Rubricoccus marinus]|uniref:Histidinol-phosphate aminotransferase n=1 Tax=Rubricoccus marinus TaxID=716817 RepID=A0A259TW08_9BACT|nr:histidinol-phosphate transaminase [Rubricoccus marinus]OZC01764.1 histidinol-phosphate transaminase [Rubricoccus marinus]
MSDAPTHLVREAIRRERAYRVPTQTGIAAKLDQNESPYSVLDAIKDAALQEVRETPWNRYPDDRPHRLVAAVAEQWGLAPEAVIVGHGSNEITHTLGLCFVDPGTPVVLPTPMFSLYASVMRMFEAEVTEVAPEADLTHSADAILAAATASGAALTVVTTPNNPTGQTIPHEDLKQLAAGVPGILVIDEAYHEFLTGPTALDVLAEHPNVLVMRTFSKAMGLAGLRVGTLVGHPDLIQEIEKSRLPFVVDRLAEAVALQVLARPELVAERVAESRAEHDRLADAVEAMPGCEVLRGKANFFLFRTPLAHAAVRETLAARGVNIRDVTGYPDLAPRDGTPGWLRVSIGTPEENDAFLASLESVIRDA